MEIADEFLQDKPTIDNAVRNYLAYQLGRITVSDLYFDRIEIQKVLGSLLRQINSLKLHEPSENPNIRQDSRQFRQYQQFYYSWKEVKDRDEKITKSFGRAGLKLIWPEVYENVLTECNQKKIDLVTAKSVLKPFSLTFYDVEDRDDETASDQVEEEVQESIEDDLTSLVWAVDFNEELRRRQSKRRENAKKRLDEIERLKRDMAAALTVNAEEKQEGPTVEEIDEE